jgi:hypothetical protein
LLLPLLLLLPPLRPLMPLTLPLLLPPPWITWGWGGLATLSLPAPAAPPVAGEAICAAMFVVRTKLQEMSLLFSYGSFGSAKRSGVLRSVNAQSAPATPGVACRC